MILIRKRQMQESPGPRYDLKKGEAFIGWICDHCGLPVPIIKGSSSEFVNDQSATQEVAQVCTCVESREGGVIGKRRRFRLR